MRRLCSVFVLLSLCLVVLPSAAGGVRAAQSGARVEVLDRQGAAITRLTDGDTLRLRITLEAKASTATPVNFELVGEPQPVAACSVPAGDVNCQSEPFQALGWHWAAGGQAQSGRSIVARAAGAPLGLPASVTVAARPVVMVHGFASSSVAWVDYLGPNGFLAGIAMPAFAVGDGQVEGAMNTGSLDNPTGRTNTIAENAAILAKYIQGVHQKTGAQMVDLLGHSMGGLISRYYIDRLMGDRDVAQLITLGTPMAGTDCAALPASLGFYLPATLEIRPSYVQGIFNAQIVHRHGVPFFALAGNAIVQAVSAPCTGTPTDVAVSYDSATSIPVQVSQLPILHPDLTHSEQVFREFVKPLLEKRAGEYAPAPDPAAPAGVSSPLQFARVESGHLAAGSSKEVTVQIDAGVTLASFALYDSSRSLDVSVRGASGNTIALSAQQNGLIMVSDPSTLVYLGYGFQNPKPGAWKVTLLTTSKTPPGGADFALSAHYAGGAQLQASADPLLPVLGKSVHLTAALDETGQPLTLDSAQAVTRGPGGSQIVPMALDGSKASADWTPAEAGIYGIDVLVIGHAGDGSKVERTAFVTVQSQPAPDSFGQARLVAGVIASVVVAGLLYLGWLAMRRVFRRKR